MGEGLKEFLASVFWMWIIWFQSCFRLIRLRFRRPAIKGSPKVLFVHKFACYFGGGEKVLWSGVHSLVKKSPLTEVTLMAHMTCTPDELFSRLDKSFKLEFSSQMKKRISFSLLPPSLVTPAPKFLFMTRLCEYLQGIAIAFFSAAEFRASGVIFSSIVETEGAPSCTYALKKLFKFSKVVSYVHYPFIDTKLIKSGPKGLAKLPKYIYNRLVVFLYRFFLQASDVVVANSSWSAGKVRKLLPEKSISIIFPPCNTSSFKIKGQKKPHLISFAQFRPEKCHDFQIKLFARLLSQLKDEEKKEVKLVLVGSVRNDDDRALVQHLQNLVSQLSLENHVEFKVNVDFQEITRIFEDSAFGIHTMKKEHFGIALVEMIAAGLVVTAWNHAGPRKDIIVESGVCGFLCSSEEEFEKNILKLFKDRFEGRMDLEEQIRENALRKRISEFSQDAFEDKFAKLFA
mgnify:CR=1 FL=1